MKKNLFNGLMLAALFLASVGLTSCLNDDDETIVLETPSTGIPDDSQATANPEIPSGSTTTTIPNVQTTVDYVNGVPVIRIDMTGIKNTGDTDWMRLYGTGYSNQNVWVEVDGQPKGILVYNNADDAGTENIPVDIVFTIDNSSSMKEEADVVAHDIKDWAEQLVKSGLNVRFGIVGYGGFISGAIDLTTVEELSDYLDKYVGTSRTQHFGGKNATSLSDNARNFPKTGTSTDSNECGAMAIQFADKYFTFRNGANRIYVNFTDEPNQPSMVTNYSVNFFSDQNNWPASKGTVHTVYSSNDRKQEYPWLISEYTGGTTIFTSSNFAGVTLSSLPVTGAMENSYIIRFTNISDLIDDGKTHLVHITVYSKDGKVRADKTFWVTFVSK